MTDMKCYHDVSITGMSHDGQANRLIMQTQTEAGKKGTVAFVDVAGWDLSPFAEQNILFDLHAYDAATLPDWLKSDFSISKEYLDALASGNKKLFFLEASIGMGGYVIASSMVAGS